MLKFMKWSVWNLVLAVLFPAGVMAQNFVYANNDQATTNSISAFSADTNGALSEIAGSPFPTGGAGRGFGLYSPNRIIVVNNLLYASNAASNSVSAFTIDTGTGVLTSVAGSPFPTNAIDDIGHSGISLAATPDGEYLYAGSTGFDGQFFGSITIFSIDTSTGALTMVGAAPVSSGGPVYSMKVTPDGKFLAVALAQTSQIAVFAIQSDGTLQAVTNSPFTLSSDPATGVDINCGSNLLFAGSATENIYAFSISSDGQLAPVTGSPFATGLSSTQVVTLSTDDSMLYTSNAADNTVVAFPAGSDGSLTLPGTVEGAGTDAISPGGLSVSQDGTLLYAADTAISGLGVGGISTFTLGGAMQISFASLTPTGVSSQLHSVAAYPPKVCSSPPPSTGLAADLQISSSPPPGFDLNATLSLDSSLVADPLTQPVTIQIGDFSLNLPAGSFKYFQDGVNEGTYLFQGVIGRTTLKVQIVPLAGNEFQISAYGKHVDTSNLSGALTVTVGIGDSSASTSVTPTAAELRGNWRDF